MDFSVIGIDGGWFIEAWRSSNGWVDQASSCSAPGPKVSGGTDSKWLGQEQFEDYSVQ
jgi:hypothetical protein